MFNKEIKSECSSCNCGGFKPPKKGDHLDTQLFPECKDTPCDRDVVKKNRKRKKASVEKVAKSPLLESPTGNPWKEWKSKRYNDSNLPSLKEAKEFVRWVHELYTVGGNEFIESTKGDDIGSKSIWNNFKKVFQDFKNHRSFVKAAIELQKAMHRAEQEGVPRSAYALSYKEIQMKKEANLNLKLSASLEKVTKEETPYNPWAVCTETVGRDDKEKYESCVKSVKKKNKKASSFKVIKMSKCDPEISADCSDLNVDELRKKRDIFKEKQNKYKEENNGKTNDAYTKKLREINFAIRSKGGWKSGEGSIK